MGTYIYSCMQMLFCQECFQINNVLLKLPILRISLHFNATSELNQPRKRQIHEKIKLYSQQIQ